MATEQFVVLQGAEEQPLTKLADYREAGGFAALAKARSMEPGKVVEEILESGLRGRGGAFFPTGRKASFLAKGTGKPTYLVVNADESEPGTFKDREIMFSVPHRLLEGCLITAHAIESDRVFIYIRGEYLHEFEVLRAAMDEVREAGLLDGVTIVLHRGAGAYICGEETALLESLEGKRGQPRTKPPFPAVAGLYASPSLINNVETIATVPKIVELGGAEYAKIGLPPDSSGTRVFSLSGNVVNGGNYELPMGVTLRELIFDENLGGGIPNGRQLKAVIPGGSSVPVLSAEQLDTPLDATSMAEAGLDARLRRDHRHRRPLLHGAARPAGRAVLHARELRQVHAVPRGHALDGADPRLDRGGHRRAGRPRPPARRLRPDPRQVPLPARRRGRDARRQLHQHVPCRVPGASRRRLPDARRVVARGGPGPGRPAHPRARGRGPCMSAPERVKVTVDGREVEVAPGTGLVETAAAAGIEIPVFCYEPRLGPPIGACRMCLVEIEGVPKLQAGCTLTAQDGMVVKTAASSDKAAEGQNATLEFILVNHPLDCPVCDKGGECPLQDLTFKYGPGSTRMNFEKRTFDKPIPISPAIALDRERCILCYRCTRFSSDVAEDGQLVARNRGAQSLITTFEDEAYRAPFSGNVIELCPVGALTSTQYRFEARPWEIQNVPSVCGLCPVGCNISATTREGKVKRILSRNHPEVDQGWLCDKGRFAFPHLYADDRIVDPLERVRRRGFAELSWDEAVDRAETLLRGAQGRIVTALSGSETVEQAYALGKLLREGLGAHSAVLPEATSTALDAFRAPLSAIADAEIVVVVGEEQVADRAPIVDLWIRQARRNGARVERVAQSKDLADELEAAVQESERAILIWSGRGGGGGARLAELAHRLGLDGKPGCAAFHLPSTPNGRGVAEAWSAAAEGEEENPEPIGLLIVSGDEAAADPAVRALAEEAESVLAITMFHGLAVGWADLVLPGTSYLERDGSMVNLEGRVQRLRRSVIPPVPDELAWISKLAERFGVEVSPHASVVFGELAERAFAGLSYGEVGARAPLPARTAYEPPPPAPVAPLPPAEAPTPEHFLGTLTLQRYKPLFSGPAVERVPELQFQRPGREIELARDDAERRQIGDGDEVTVRSNGTSLQLRARVSRALAAGTARIAEEHAHDLHRDVEVVKA